jgi:hypothetical protein
LGREEEQSWDALIRNALDPDGIRTVHFSRKRFCSDGDAGGNQRVSEIASVQESPIGSLLAGQNLAEVAPVGAITQVSPPQPGVGSKIARK